MSAPRLDDLCRCGHDFGSHHDVHVGCLGGDWCRKDGECKSRCVWCDCVTPIGDASRFTPPPGATRGEG
jgi:hypothetical protein